MSPFFVKVSKINGDSDEVNRAKFFLIYLALVHILDLLRLVGHILDSLKLVVANILIQLSVSPMI